jgi:putative stress-induced transcription regulator
VTYSIESHEFAARDFLGGDAALDFINTVSGRHQSPRDWLDSYARLFEWATRVRLLPERNLRVLTKNMHSEPATFYARSRRGSGARP